MNALMSKLIIQSISMNERQYHSIYIFASLTKRTLIPDNQIVMTKENSPSNFSKTPSEFIAKRIIVEPRC